MKPFEILTPETAQPPVNAMLAGIRDTLGFVPNVFGTLAGSATALQAFIELNARFAESSFDTAARELIQTAASVENQCSYCVAGHSAFAQMQDVPREWVDAVRDNRAIADRKRDALVRFTRALVRGKGMLSEHELQHFVAAGYTPAQVLEVILGVCLKTFSNLASNALGIPLDEAFAEHAWPATPSSLYAVK